MKDYYKILEIEENASEDDIKKSYRTLSKKYHPDVNPEGSEKFKEISEAYEILKDKNKRDQYNFSRKNPNNHDMHSIFEQMFRNSGGFTNRHKSSPSKVINLDVSPIESFLGSEKTFFYSRQVFCNTCAGFGGQHKVCGNCNGSGVVMTSFGTGFLMQRVSLTCNSCNGRGYTLITHCHQCGGVGTNQESKTLRIKIPVASDNGQFLKLKELGDYSNGGYGDLVVQIKVNPKDGYEKFNNDLIYNLYLDLDGIKQDKYQIPHPNGELTFKAPDVFDSSKPLRLKGKGYRNGDMYVKLHVKFDRLIK